VLRLPARPDAAQGGYVVNTAAIPPAALGDKVRGSLQGWWGFDPYQGPGFELRNAHADAWSLAAGDEDDLIVGRQDTVHLRSSDVACVDRVMLRDPAGKELKVEWKAVDLNEVEVKLPLQGVQPGAMTLLIAQSGGAEPQAVPISVFSDAGRLDTFTLHSGDAQGVLKGGRLDLVAGLTVGGVAFAPGELTTDRGTDALPMIATDAPGAAALKPERGLMAKVKLRDGRESRVAVAIDAARPRVALIGKSVRPSKSSQDSNIQLAHKDDQLPHDAVLTFSLRAELPAAFARSESIEGGDRGRRVLDHAEHRQRRPAPGKRAGGAGDARSGESVRLLGLREPEVPAGERDGGRRLAAAGVAGAPADAEGADLSRRCRDGVQAVGFPTCS